MASQNHKHLSYPGELDDHVINKLFLFITDVVRKIPLLCKKPHGQRYVPSLFQVLLAPSTIAPVPAASYCQSSGFACGVSWRQQLFLGSQTFTSETSGSRLEDQMVRDIVRFDHHGQKDS